MSAPARFAIGRSDFRYFRESGAVYVDKTRFVSGVLSAAADVLLFPRPRRFGKTTNLSTLRWFLEKTTEDRSALFEGLAVWSDAAARAHFQKYPVIFLTFKDVKALDWKNCRGALAGVLSRAYDEHRYLLDEGALTPSQAATYSAIIEERASDSQLWSSLATLSQHLARRHGEKVVILIDEYDTPIHASFTHQYEDEVLTFFRNFLGSALKDNPHLFKGVLTGILRAAKESLFSGLNNLAVYSLARSEFATSFGFTEEEVQRLVGDDAALMEGIRAWYNGYLFGGQVIYNPWSVTNFLASEDRQFRPYWTATGSNELLGEILLRRGAGLRGDLETLLTGGSIEKDLKEDIVLRQVHSMPDAVWSFLLFTGYLKPLALFNDDRGLHATLSVPNREILLDLEDLVRTFMQVQTGGEVERLLSALLGGDERTFEHLLSRFLVSSMSYHDPAIRTPEQVYHAFVLGLLVGLRPRFDVKSNQESGFGRCDLLVLPKSPGEPGIALELKTLDTDRGETVEQALRSALSQIRDKRYTAALEERGARPIYEMAAVFDGKRVWVERRTFPAPPPLISSLP